jgi:serine/threonine-protein kinase HipA
MITDSRLTLEIHHSGSWHAAATLEVPAETRGKGYASRSAFSYGVEYVNDHVGNHDRRALSCRFPVSFEYFAAESWPAFLLDILPSGAARRVWVRNLGAAIDQPGLDFDLLRSGAGNPPGNIRVAEAAQRFEKNTAHLGFKRDEVITKNENFIEYARNYGAPVSGSSGALGDAPKWLLTQDRSEGNWHADGALVDERAARHWIVKFPRGRDESDRRILRTEAIYMKVAKKFGARVAELLEYESDTLFIPRFDRVVHQGKVIRYGLETLASLAGIVKYGESPKHEVLVTALAQYSSDRDEDLFEYLRRDVLNLALKNTDNHARNSSVLKKDDGSVRLSPLYDFAPMFLDRDGIARSIGWASEAAPRILPDWGDVLQFLLSLCDEPRALKERFPALAHDVQQLPQHLEDAGADRDLIDRLSTRIRDVAQSITEARYK